MSTDDQQQDEDQESKAPVSTDGQPAPTEPQVEPPDDPEDRDDSGDEHEDTPAEDDGDPLDEGDTFPRPYVQRIRDRSAGYRKRANAAEARTGELEAALWSERVRALGVLADPDDLAYSAELLDDPDAMADAVQALVTRKPHLRRRGAAPRDTTGADQRHDGTTSTSLLGIMRHGA